MFIKEISSFIDANYIETEHISTNVVCVFEYEFISSMIPCRKMLTHANPDAESRERDRESEWKKNEKGKRGPKKTNDYGALNKHVMKFENDFSIMIISSIH